jgi:predicted phosphodiesterase
MRPTIVLGDIHLFRDTPRKVVDDLVAVLRRHAGARVIFAGDLLDLSAEGVRKDADFSVGATLGGLEAHRTLFAALGEHVIRDGELWLVSGNHDAEVGADDFAGALADRLDLTGAARQRIRTTPWFFRDGALHVEHGHLYDPDNAPAHPLVTGKSLGVHFVEEFIAPTGAHRYLNANDRPPMVLLTSAFRWYGARAPYVVYRFFRAAFGALAQSGSRFPEAEQRRRGQALADEFAAQMGVSPAWLDELLATAPRPTLTSTRATFARCYLDRVMATAAIVGGAVSLSCHRPVTGAVAISAGALGLLASWAAGYDRYTGSVSERLEEGASRVSAITQAKLVVFGHTHREALNEGYANTGSFSFPGAAAAGRPYLEIAGPAEAPRAVRHYLTSR